MSGVARPAAGVCRPAGEAPADAASPTSVLARGGLSFASVVFGGVGGAAAPGTLLADARGPAAVQDGASLPALFWWWRPPVPCGSGGRAGARPLQVESAVSAGADVSFLSRRRAGPVRRAAVVREVAGTNSARHGVVHPWATLRAPCTAAQVFLFHGEWHVLHHPEGVVRAAAEGRGGASPAAAQGRGVDGGAGAGAGAGAAWRPEGSRRRFVRRGMRRGGGGCHGEGGGSSGSSSGSSSGGDDVADAAVDYAEALLLPAVPARAASACVSVACGGRGEGGGTLHDDAGNGVNCGCADGGPTQRRASAGAARGGAAAPGAPAAAALPATLTAVGCGAFCLPRTVAEGEGASRVLARWGFGPVAGEHSARACGGAASRRLPLAAFTARLCVDVLPRRGSWWPLEPPPAGGGGDTTSDDDDDDDDDVCGVAPWQFDVPRGGTPHRVAAPMPRPLASTTMGIT
ncbi:uncharacterized protein Tco025E_09516 [Trypanosoma conorhini]|uniref:Uncharacterized protein n=1 Tax=Trypanosoma conorhini TaxID=83891 RepID=A0A422MVL8_9TRYP|nr:uncharacterized protein Tco025E_09516 [Trypanosoma conorhini]RNE97240.1 hypothetical protein Tco025E_09516 [Trypanosoma conorhini]